MTYNNYKIICAGDVGNESIFAIILHTYNRLKDVKCINSTATDWSRMMNASSPYLFKDYSYLDKIFIENTLKNEKYTMFLRKVDTDFPDSILLDYIYREDSNSSLTQERKKKIFWLETKLRIHWVLTHFYIFFWLYFLLSSSILFFLYYVKELFIIF
jgi:hypothetical protein